MAHKLGLPITIMATAPALEDAQTIELMKMYHSDFDDEIGLSFHTLDSPEITKIAGYQEVALWMYDYETKGKVIKYFIDRFRTVFGFEPTSAASYHFDASSMRILLEECPAIQITVAGCFEEGVRVFHGCNNSWYLFNEGMPWGAWYPSKTNTLRPAKNEEDAFGVVAVPHLTRDMVLAYEGRNDFWASHPPNVQRGMGNKGESCAYDNNLIDQHRYQEKFNSEFSYLNVFVGAQWLIHNHNSEEPPAVSVALYQHQLEYIKSLVVSGEATAERMTEFGKWYKKNVPINHKEIFLAKEILYGSGKHYFWYIDPQMRLLFDLTQGCSLGDIRPYLSEIEVSTGIGTKHGVFGSYPYLVHSQHRTGYLNHFSDGSRSTAILKCGEIEVDMADVAFHCQEVLDDQKGFVTNAVDIHFGNKGVATMITRVTISEQSEIFFERELVALKGADELEITEYFKGCYGTTEYPEDLSTVELSIDNEPENSFIFGYKRRELSKKEAKSLIAKIPPMKTQLELRPEDGHSWEGSIAEGILFNPYYTLKLKRVLKPEKTSKICLCLKIMK